MQRATHLPATHPRPPGSTVRKFPCLLKLPSTSLEWPASFFGLSLPLYMSFTLQTTKHKCLFLGLIFCNILICCLFIHLNGFPH